MKDFLSYIENLSIKKINKTYSLCGYKFELYEIINIDKIKKSDLPKSEGLYCFTKKEEVFNVSSSAPHYFQSIHKLIYLGMTEDFTDRLPFHNKQGEIKKAGATHLGICILDGKTKDEIKSMESDLLDKYFFQENEKENESKQNKKTNVVED